MAIVLACEVCGGPTVGAVGEVCEGCPGRPVWGRSIGKAERMRRIVERARQRGIASKAVGP